MATLKFIGFPDGAKVSVDALQDAQTESATVDAWGDPVVRPTVAIRVTRAPVPEARHAPEGVKFEAFPSDFGFRDFGPQQDYDPEFHEIFYEWDFGDNRSPWTAPRLPDEFNAPSKGYGKRVGHVFVEPGEFMVTCTARQIVSLDPLQVLSAKTTTLVKVTDPEDIYGAQLTAVVALDGDFTGAPASNYRFTSTAAARTFVETRRRTSGMIFRVLLKRGEDYRWDLDAKRFLIEDWKTDDDYGVAYIGAWGSGDKPLVPGIPCQAGRDTSLVVQGLRHEGDYDVNSDTYLHNGLSDATDPSAPAGSNETILTGAWLTVVDCDIASVGGIGLRVRTVSEDMLKPPFDGSDWYVNRLFVDNVDIDGTGDYCTLIGLNARDFTSFTGCGLKDDPYMLTQAVPPRSKRHSAIRTERNGEFYFDGLDIFARSGWSFGGAWGDGLSTAQPQPCVRFAGKNASPLVMDNLDIIDPFKHLGSSYMTRCVFEGAGTIYTRETANVTRQQLLGNDVLDRCLILCGPQTVAPINTATGGLTVRGCVMVSYDNSENKIISEFVGGRPEYTTIDDFDVPLDRIKASPVQVYSNTLAFLHDPDGLPASAQNPRIVGDDATQEFDHVANENNVLYAPLAPLAEDRLVHTPDLTTIGLTPRYLGRRTPTEGPAPTAPFASGEDGIVIQPRLCFKAARGLMEVPEVGDVPGLYIDQSAGAQKMLSGEWYRFNQVPIVEVGTIRFDTDGNQLGAGEAATLSSGVFTIGQRYRLHVNVSGNEYGDVYIGCGDLSVPENRAVFINAGDGFYEGVLTATSTDLTALATGTGFDGRLGINIFETLEVPVRLPTEALDLAANAGETQASAVEVGKWYIFKLTVSNHVSGALHLGTGDMSVEANRSLDAIDADGTYEGIIQVTSTDLSYAATAAGFEGEITLEVFEVPGNHLTPSAGPAFALGGDPGTMPIVDDTGTLEWSPTGTSYTVCHVRADKTYTWDRNVPAATAADILQQSDTLGFFATEQDMAEDTDVLYHLRQDHGVMQTQYGTGDVLGWYEPTDPAEIPAVTGLPVVLEPIKGQSVDELSPGTGLIQGAHIEGTQSAAQSPISSSGAGVAQGPGDEDIHDFLVDGTFTLDREATIVVQLVGGGGGGGSVRGGGGGAGGVIQTSIELPAGTYTVGVGDGGVTAIQEDTVATNGGDTFILDSNGTTDILRARGGGSGGRPVDAQIGGSGGGGGGFSETIGAAGTAGQGNDGGDGVDSGVGSPGGGGGGASAAGGAGQFSGSRAGGDGGDGVSSSVPGETGHVGGGGGGQSQSGPAGAGGLGGGGAGALTLDGLNEPGAPNTGGGAGGNANTTESGGPGGSGRATIWWVPE